MEEITRALLNNLLGLILGLFVGWLITSSYYEKEKLLEQFKVLRNEKKI